MRSRSRSASPAISGGGAESERSTDSGRPADMPGVNSARSTALRMAAMRDGFWPLSVIPAFQRAATAFGSPVSTQGAKSSGLSLGNVRRRLARSHLHVEHDGGNAVDGRLFEECDAQARLAAPRHADAECVGREVTRVVEQRSALGVADEEGPELFNVDRHLRFPVTSISRRRFFARA